VLLFAVLAVVSLVGTILIVPTHPHYPCPTGAICEGYYGVNQTKVAMIFLEALLIVTLSAAAAILWNASGDSR